MLGICQQIRKQDKIISMHFKIGKQNFRGRQKKSLLFIYQGRQNSIQIPYLTHICLTNKKTTFEEIPYISECCFLFIYQKIYLPTLQIHTIVNFNQIQLEISNA